MPNPYNLEAGKLSRRIPEGAVCQVCMISLKCSTVNGEPIIYHRSGQFNNRKCLCIKCYSRGILKLGKRYSTISPELIRDKVNEVYQEFMKPFIGEPEPVDISPKKIMEEAAYCDVCCKKFKNKRALNVHKGHNAHKQMVSNKFA